MKVKLTSLAVFICICSFTQKIRELRYADKIRIKEAINISTQYGDKLWKRYSAVPLEIILITDSTEFLINHQNLTSEFKLLELNGCNNTLSPA